MVCDGWHVGSNHSFGGSDAEEHGSNYRGEGGVVGFSQRPRGSGVDVFVDVPDDIDCGVGGSLESESFHGGFEFGFSLLDGGEDFWFWLGVRYDAFTEFVRHGEGAVEGVSEVVSKVAVIALVELILSER